MTLEVVEAAPPRFAVRHGVHERSDRTIRALLRRAGRPLGNFAVRLRGRDGAACDEIALEPGDELDWIELSR
jgi:hypothetical protein